MTFMSRAAAIAALTLALTGPALAADASGNNWKTLSTTAGGKIQACKVATTANGPWKVRLRVDATHATGKVQGSAVVTDDGKATKEKWRSGWVFKGHVSDLGVVKLQRGKLFELSAGIGTTNMGNGGSFKAGAIRGC
jgi:hypothetical protein